MLSLSLFFCGSNIVGLYHKLNHNPISVSFSEQPYSIENVRLHNMLALLLELPLPPFQLPFPSITFVSDFIFDDYKVLEIMQKKYFNWDFGFESIKDDVSEDQDGLEYVNNQQTSIILS